MKTLIPAILLLLSFQTFALTPGKYEQYSPGDIAGTFQIFDLNVSKEQISVDVVSPNGQQIPYTEQIVENTLSIIFGNADAASVGMIVVDVNVAGNRKQIQLVPNTAQSQPTGVGVSADSSRLLESYAGLIAQQQAAIEQSASVVSALVEKVETLERRLESANAPDITTLKRELKSELSNAVVHSVNTATKVNSESMKAFQAKFDRFEKSLAVTNDKIESVSSKVERKNKSANVTKKIASIEKKIAAEKKLRTELGSNLVSVSMTVQNLEKESKKRKSVNSQFVKKAELEPVVSQVSDLENLVSQMSLDNEQTEQTLLRIFKSFQSVVEISSAELGFKNSDAVAVNTKHQDSIAVGLDTRINDGGRVPSLSSPRKNRISSSAE